MMRRSVISVFALLITLVACSSAAPSVWAQEYPNRPIRLIVPFGPGGGSDYVGRLVGQKLTEQTGQQIVVDNRPGAASLVGPRSQRVLRRTATRSACAMSASSSILRTTGRRATTR